MSQVHLEMKVMLKFSGTELVDELVPRHLDHREMPMILSRYTFPFPCILNYVMGT